MNLQLVLYWTKNKNVKARVFNWLDKIVLPNSYNFFEYCPSKKCVVWVCNGQSVYYFLLYTYITISIKLLNKQGLPKIRIKKKKNLKGFFNQKTYPKDLHPEELVKCLINYNALYLFYLTSISYLISFYASYYCMALLKAKKVVINNPQNKL